MVEDSWIYTPQLCKLSKERWFFFVVVVPLNQSLEKSVRWFGCS